MDLDMYGAGLAHDVRSNETQDELQKAKSYYTTYSPGLGYLYSGLVRRKNALSLLFLTIVALAITSFQWWFW